MNKFLFYNYLPVLADHIIDAKYSNRIVHHNYPPFIIDNIKNNDVIFVAVDFLSIFFQQYYPKIKNKFYLLSGVGGLDVNNNFLKYLKEDKIIKWIGCNLLFKHSKIKKIPIAFEENELPGGNQILLNKLYNYKSAFHNKINKLLITKMGNTHVSRYNIKNIFENKDFCDILTDRLPFEDFMNKINKYKFVLSPRGRGTDTHRFWEILLVGSIPIVESSGLDDLYNKFPCIIIKSFLEINKNLLDSYQYDSEKEKNIEKYLLIENFNSMISEEINNTKI